jgi:AraC-like DNA-binding protein
VLDGRQVLRRDGLAVTDVACRHERGRGVADAYAGGHAVIFVRRGCFVRSAEGEAALLDPTTAYAVTPGDEERFDHPHEHGDDCTSISLAPELVAQLWGAADPVLPRTGLRVDAALDLEHRLLLAAARRADDPHELVERAITLAAGALATAAPERLARGAPSRTARAHRALADGVREALAADPDRSLPDLARGLAVSPHHLSRVFRAQAGTTIAAHRLRLRARAALERLNAGESDLARLALDVGFADQSHLSRVLRRETGRTPAALRAALAGQLV